MSLLENLGEAQAQKPLSRKCVIARQLDAAHITDEESTKLQEMLWPSYTANRIPTTHLARALRKSGIPVSDKSLERHRHYDCSCTR